MAIDVTKLVGLFEVAMKIFECLQKMQPAQRAKLLSLVEKVSGVEGIAADVEALVSSE
jgi:hypothetical protein